jgi:hypothetical protein
MDTSTQSNLEDAMFLSKFGRKIISPTRLLASIGYRQRFCIEAMWGDFFQQHGF